MNPTRNTPHTRTTRHLASPRPRRRLGVALPLLVGAALAFGACSNDDDADDATTTDDPTESVADTPTTDAPDVTDGGAAAGGIEPAQACGLLDASAVDGWLGTSGVTTSVDTSLGLFDGCRWATAATDVPALLVGYDPTMDFETVRDMACDGTTAEPAPAAGADAVACFGAVVARAGSGVVLVGVDDPTFGLDDAAQLAIATQAAAAITGA